MGTDQHQVRALAATDLGDLGSRPTQGHLGANPDVGECLSHRLRIVENCLLQLVGDDHLRRALPQEAGGRRQLHRVHEDEFGLGGQVTRGPFQAGVGRLAEVHACDNRVELHRAPSESSVGGVRDAKRTVGASSVKIP
jgi:hypothetical protein